MPNNQDKCRREDWERIRAYCRGAAAEPLICKKTAPDWTCDALPPLDRLCIMGRYLVLSLAQHIPVSEVKVWLYRRLGMRIGRGVYISPGVIVDPLFPELITVEDGALLGLGCRLLTHDYSAESFRIGRVCVGQGAVIGAFSTIRAGVTIGRRATVGASSFVNRDVPDGTMVGGVPARQIIPAEEGAVK